jgi:predicted alpha-1,2-mannosidase
MFVNLIMRVAMIQEYFRETFFRNRGGSLHVYAAVAIAVWLTAAVGCPAGTDLAHLVNPFIGTSADGNVFPGADMPAGMVQWSPDSTVSAGGYRWNDPVISRGFSLTHFSGRGCSASQDFPFMPTIGPLTASPVTNVTAYKAGFAHDNESAAPGYYRVRLDPSGINVELTVTMRTGMGRFTFPASTQANMVINLNGSANGNRDSSVSIVGSNQITGQTTSKIGCGSSHYTIYFAAEFDQPFTGFGVWNNDVIAPNARSNSNPATAAYLTFDTTKNPVVQVRVAISYVSVANAWLNLKAENSAWDFNAVRNSATSAWNSVLNRIQVTGGTADEQTVFYTALYHCFLDPNVFSDVNGQYLGFDGQIHTAGNYTQYENLTSWDNYRSLIQLRALLTPSETGDMMQSLVNDALQGGGAMPRWEQVSYNSGGMVGDGPTISIANAYAFGARNFDVQAAMKAADLAASTVGAKSGGQLAREGLADYLTKGFVVGARNSTSGPAITLEYANDDFALAQLARALGDTKKYELYLSRSGNWRNVFNADSKYVQLRGSDGSWPTDARLTTSMVEGDAYQYTWMLSYNVHGLFDAMGGNAAAVQRLDTHLTKLNDGPTSVYAWVGNEPEEVMPWEYDFAGVPWRTQDVTRRIELELYRNTPDGLPGNDDGGAMSSWVVWDMLGMFPEIPGVGGFVIGSPLFSSVTITPPSGHVIKISGVNAGEKNRYVQSLLVNGQPSSHLWLPIETILSASNTTLEYTLSDTPNMAWGSAESDAPPSFADNAPASRPSSISTTDPSRANTSR